MSKKTKIWIFSALIVIIVGALIFVSIMSVLRWDFTKLSSTKYQTNIYQITEDFTSITINEDSADISFVPSTDNKNLFCILMCFDNESLQEIVCHSSRWFKIILVRIV